jgi:hypothetical protein
MCSATPLVEGWGPGFGGLRGLKRIFDYDLDYDFSMIYLMAMINT